MTAPSHSLVKQVNQHYLPDDHFWQPPFKGAMDVEPEYQFGQPPLKGATDDEPSATEDEPSAKAFDNWLNIDGFGMVWYTPTYSGEFMPLQKNTTVFRLFARKRRARETFFSFQALHG